MSYILDALRKAERERRVSPVPTLDTAHDRPTPARRSAWPLALAGALAAGAVAISVVWGLWALGPRDLAQQALTPATPAAGAGSAAKATVAAPTGPPVSLSSARGDPGPGQAAVAPAAPPPTVVEPAERPPAVASVRSPARVPDAPGPADDARSPSEDSARVRTPPVGRPRAAPSGAAGGSTIADVRPAEPAPTPAAPTVPAAPAMRPPVTAPPAAALAPAPSPDTGGAGRVSPPGPSDALARLALDVLVYSEVPAERLVFINGRKYVERQAVSEDTVVEQITPDGAILQQGGRRILLRPKLNPYARPGSP